MNATVAVPQQSAVLPPGFVRQLQRAKLWQKIGYAPHPGQTPIHQAIDRDARYLYIVAGARSGKSKMLATEFLTELALEPEPGQHRRLSIIAAPEADLTDKVFTLVWRWAVQDRVFGCAPRVKSERSRYIEMPWGSRLEGKTTEQPESLMGEGVALIGMDEDARTKKGVYENFVQRNLMDYGGRVIRITTPLGKLNHSYEAFTEWSKRAQTNAAYFTHKFTSRDNPHLQTGVLDEIEQYLISVGMHDLFRQDYEGDFTVMAGAVYPHYEEQRTLEDGRTVDWHVAKPEHAKGVPYKLGIDWGFRNPFYALLAQVIEGDRIIVHDEVYMRGLTDGQKAERVGEMLARRGLRQEHLAPGFADPSSPQAIKQFREAGYPLRDPEDDDMKRLNAVLDGILRVRELLGRRDKPGIVIHERCVNLRKELPAYHFKDNAQTEQPVKEDDHSPDALRYLVMGSLGGRRPLLLGFGA